MGVVCAHPGRSHVCVAGSPPKTATSSSILGFSSASSRHPSRVLDITDGDRYLQRGPGTMGVINDNLPEESIL